MAQLVLSIATTQPRGVGEKWKVDRDPTGRGHAPLEFCPLHPEIFFCCHYEREIKEEKP